MKSLTDRVKNRLRQLLERIRAGIAGGTSAELETAKTLANKIMAEYGVTESDVMPEANKEGDKAHSIIITAPTIKGAYSWLLVLLNNICLEFSAKFIMLADNSAQVLGAEIACQQVSGAFGIATTRMEYHLAIQLKEFKNFLKIDDYRIGFSNGFAIALIEEREKKQSEHDAKENGLRALTGAGNEDENFALVTINKALAEINKALAQALAEGDIKLENENGKIEIQDMRSYAIGFTDGKLAFRSLLCN